MKQSNKNIEDVINYIKDLLEQDEKEKKLTQLLVMMKDGLAEK